jgi:L-threonylcarbamoyladenylate synthase
MTRSFKKAAELINAGDVVAVPTETVYGLAADAFNISAVKKTFQIKGRPPDNPLIVHISRIEQLETVAREIPDDALKLARRFWPGPLTLVLNKKQIVPDIVTGGLKTVAVRIPDHPLTRKLIDKTGPLTAPSANKSGRPSPTKPEHVREDFGDTVHILDGGTAKLGLESTVLDLSGKIPAILRPGYISADMISGVIGKKVSENHNNNSSSRSRSPGTRYTHYKPKASVHWLPAIPKDPDPKIYYIIHSGNREETGINIYSYKNDFEGLARDLYDHFRTADHLSCSQIRIETLPKNNSHPLISALKDRISRSIES